MEGKGKQGEQVEALGPSIPSASKGGLLPDLQTLLRYVLKPRSQELFLRCSILLSIYLLAFSIRLVSGTGLGRMCAHRFQSLARACTRIGQ